MSTTVLDALITGLVDAARVNSAVQARPAAVLWTDRERWWAPVIAELRARLPGLLELGDYAPAERRGPAIWLKCALAGVLPEVEPVGVPVLYLPGVGRADLRAIESCPRALQPLAELQYRGVYFGQINGKDWTPAAFLSSRHGGLGADLAQDNATQQALVQVLAAGVLMSLPVAELSGRRIEAEWLRRQLAPNPVRDLLVWMNDPASARQRWAAPQWEVFQTRCRSDYGFDPLADGELVAAERLAGGKGAWAAVAQQYRDAHASFPQVYALLARLPSPQLGLFPDPERLAGYPRANEEREVALRYVLNSAADLSAAAARTLVLRAEREHAPRREWLWQRMGRARLAEALGALAELATRSAVLPIGATPDELAASYQREGWQVDDAALRALAAVQSAEDQQAVGAVLRAIHLPWLQASAERLQAAVLAAGGLPKPMPLTAAPGTCWLFVDGLRYDLAQRLQPRLAALGTVTLAARWTCLPSVTASGKPWCSPVVAALAGAGSEAEFVPAVAADGKPANAHHFRRLLGDQGVAYLPRAETGDPAGQAWTEAGDLDHYGHEHGLRLAREADALLGEVLERVEALLQAGWPRIRIVTDHGWLLLPGGLLKTALPRHQTENRWGRCALLREDAADVPLSLPWSYSAAHRVALAPGVSCFVAGQVYAHGGLSLQECLVPVLDLAAASAPVARVLKLCSIRWRGLRCTVELEGELTGLRVDLRTQVAQAESSLVQPKPLADGRASLVVADEDLAGTAAHVVVLDEAGTVLLKQLTTVGDEA